MPALLSAPAALPAPPPRPPPPPPARLRPERAPCASGFASPAPLRGHSHPDSRRPVPHRRSQGLGTLPPSVRGRNLTQAFPTQTPQPVPSFLRSPRDKFTFKELDRVSTSKAGLMPARREGAGSEYPDT